MWFVLMEALRRTGGWSLLLSVLPFTALSAVCRREVARAVPRHAVTLEQTTAYHVLSGESLLGIPIQAFADTVIGFLVFGTALMMTGAGKFFINIAFAMCGTFRGGAAKVCIFASRPARHDVGGIDHLQRADRRHHDHPGDEEERISRLLCRRDRGLRVDRRGAGAAGDGRHRVRDRAVPERQLCRRRARRDHSGGAVLCRPVHAGRRLRRAPQAEGHSARRTAEVLGHDQGRLVLHVRHRAPRRDAAVFQAREPRAVLCDRAAAGPEPVLLQGHALDAGDDRQVPRSQRQAPSSN